MGIIRVRLSEDNVYVTSVGLPAWLPGGEMRIGEGKTSVVLFFKFVFGAVWIWIAPHPELTNELVALLVVVQPFQKSSLFLRCDDPVAWEPHYLIDAKVVYPRGPKAAPLLLIVTGSLNAGDGDQIISTQLVSYDIGRDEFRRVYSKSTGHNNNQEIRFILSGANGGKVSLSCQNCSVTESNRSINAEVQSTGNFEPTLPLPE